MGKEEGRQAERELGTRTQTKLQASGGISTLQGQRCSDNLHGQVQGNLVELGERGSSAKERKVKVRGQAYEQAERDESER